MHKESHLVLCLGEGTLVTGNGENHRKDDSHSGVDADSDTLRSSGRGRNVAGRRRRFLSDNRSSTLRR